MLPLMIMKHYESLVHGILVDEGKGDGRAWYVYRKSRGSMGQKYEDAEEEEEGLREENLGVSIETTSKIQGWGLH